MRKNGFTLAEVLITIGILGLLSAMLIPSLNANIMESQYVAAFKNTHSIISDKLDAAMAFEDVNDIRSLKAFSETTANGVLNELEGYLNMQAISEAHKTHAMNGKSVVYKTWPVSDTRQLHTKAFIYLEDVAQVLPTDAAAAKSIRDKGGSLIRKNGVVWIDTNGYTKPNRLGHDVFKFYLGQDGRLYPYGGSDVSLFDSNGESAEDKSWKGDYVCKKDTVGEGCAGRLYDEDKINYFKPEKAKAAAQ